MCAITDGAGQQREFPVYEDAITNQMENQLIISDEILGSADNVRAFLRAELLAGRLEGVMVKVFDLSPNIDSMNRRYFCY